MNISKSMRGSDTMISYEKKLPRCRLLGAAGMGLLAAAMLGGTTAGLMAKVPGLGEIGFEVLREGSPMGRHSIAFEERGEDLHVKIAIDLEVGLAFVTLFRYEHRNHEVWRDGRLISIETATDNDGDRFWVKGEATAEGFAVASTSGSYTAPADVIPTSYWNPRFVEQSQVLNTQDGRLIEVETRPVAEEQVEVVVGSVLATRYSTTGELALETWYTESGAWVKTAFEAKGSEVEYVLESPLDEVQSANR